MSETKEDPDSLVTPEEEKEGNVVDSTDFVFRKIGESILLKSHEAEFALENAPLQALAVSERFRLLFFAHSGGFCVVKTRDAIDSAKEIKENGKKSCLQEVSVVDVSIGQVSLLALSTDSSTLAACVGGNSLFFSVASLLNKVHEPSSSCSVGESSHVKDLRWRKDTEHSFVVLSSHGKLYRGELGGPLVDVLDDVDAVDWGMSGELVVAAKGSVLSFFSSEFRELGRMSLLFQSWIGDADPRSTVRVDSIKWVRHDSIVVGCVQLTEDGNEEGYMVQVITDKQCDFAKASCNPVVLSFTELFAYVVDDIVPAGGPCLLMCYLERWELALTANRKNTDQHIVSLGWSLGDSHGEAALVEFRQDKDLPRIELPDNGDDNLIMGLGVDKASVYEQIEFVRSTEERKQLSPYCILMCLTSDGKLVMFHVARVSDTTKPPQVFSEPKTDTSETMPLGGAVSKITPETSKDEVEAGLLEPLQVLSVPKTDTSAVVPLGSELAEIAPETSQHEVEAVVADGQLRRMDETVVQKHKYDTLPKSHVQVTGPSSNLEKNTIKSSGVDQSGSNFVKKESQIPAWTGKAQNNFTFNQPFSIVAPKSHEGTNGSAGAIRSNSFQNVSSGLKSTGNLPLGDGFSLKDLNSSTNETVTAAQSTVHDVVKNEMSKSSSGTADISSFQGVPFGLQSSGNLLLSNSKGSKLSSFASTGSAFGFGHKNAVGATESHKPTSGKVLGSKEPISGTMASILSSSRATQEEQRRVSSGVLQKAAFVPSVHTSVIAKPHGSKGNVMLHQKTHLSNDEPELSKSFHNVNDMVKELDILLAHIEEEGGFRDACTIFLESSVIKLEEGLEMISERCRNCKNTIAEQARDIQQLQDNTLQLLARKIYVDGLLKQATDKQYWELWNRQKLNPEFETKQRQIDSLHQTLINQLIELERHFNMLELKRFGDSERVTMGRRTFCRSLKSSREVESLHSLHNTVMSQLAVAEQLSECLSRQMSMLKVESPPSKRKNVTKELFESIGLPYDVADNFVSPVAKRTCNDPGILEKTMPSSFSNTKEPSRRSLLSALKGTEPETSRRRRDSLGMNLTSFEPQKTTVKRMTLEKRRLGREDTLSFRKSHDIFDAHIEEDSSVVHTIDQNKTRHSSFSLSAKKELKDRHQSEEIMNLNPPVQASESSSPSLFKWAKDQSGVPHFETPKSASLHDVQRAQLPISSLGSFGLVNSWEQTNFGGRQDTEPPHGGKSNPSPAQTSAISQAESQKFGSPANQALIRTTSRISPLNTSIPDNAADEKPYISGISNINIGENLQMLASASGVPVSDLSPESSTSQSLSKLSESSSTVPKATKSFEAKDANQEMPTAKVSSSTVSRIPFSFPTSQSSSSTSSHFSSLSSSVTLSPLPESATPSSSTTSISSNSLQQSPTAFKPTKDVSQTSPILMSSTPLLSSKLGSSSVATTSFLFSTQLVSSTSSSSSFSSSSPSVVEQQLSTVSPSVLQPENVESGVSSENKAPLKSFSVSASSPASISTIGTPNVPSSSQLEPHSEHKQTSLVANSSEALARNSSGNTTSSFTVTLGPSTFGSASNTSSHSQPGITSMTKVQLPASPLTTQADLKNETSDVAISQEDEMEEEASEASTSLNLGALGGFGLGEAPASSGPKPNPFGGSFSTTSSSNAASFSLTVPSGELFRPASFSFPSLSPPQPSQSPNQSGFSGGFGSGTGAQPGASGFGQPAQIGAGQQALGSVLGAFGQSRQLGPGLPVAGFASSSGFGGGFSKAGTGGFASLSTSSGGFAGLSPAGGVGGFAGAAAGGGGFAGAAAGGGGFAGAAGGGGGFAGAAGGGGGFVGAAAGVGGFAAAASSGGAVSPTGGFSAFGSMPGGGGFSSFGAGNNMATGKPSELFTMMRK
ncbi:hypothetical protein H6P81_003046 [Aristolochia fimbriata]|uniref:Nuclear pore complex protein NUP214 n=1 Tax=Aristolochia fimbriata TaxID=158543 RepID=A0AAV7FFZ0_ARIFI|nr:hypothetical protein H6P81_003046 [Aristolochia fimbriata]